MTEPSKHSEERLPSDLLEHFSSCLTGSCPYETLIISFENMLDDFKWVIPSEQEHGIEVERELPIPISFIESECSSAEEFAYDDSQVQSTSGEKVEEVVQVVNLADINNENDAKGVRSLLKKRPFNRNVFVMYPPGVYLWDLPCGGPVSEYWDVNRICDKLKVTTLEEVIQLETQIIKRKPMKRRKQKSKRRSSKKSDKAVKPVPKKEIAGPSSSNPKARKSRPRLPYFLRNRTIRTMITRSMSGKQPKGKPVIITNNKRNYKKNSKNKRSAQKLPNSSVVNPFRMMKKTPMKGFKPKRWSHKKTLIRPSIMASYLELQNTEHKNTNILSRNTIKRKSSSSSDCLPENDCTPKKTRNGKIY